jgi:predicted DNA-binding transcriptional regulator YafY
MSSYIISLRIQLLIQYVYDNKYPTKEAILKYLKEKDLAVASRTIERYLEKIRADFGIEIEYDSKERGYFINEEKSVKVDSFFKFLEIVQVADIFTKSLKDSNKMLEYVSFDDSKNFKGIDNLKDLLLAIKDNREITFQHENYWKNSTKPYTVTPLILKEYLNRWYVICVIDNNDTIRTFGLDRISNIEIKEFSNKKRKDYFKKLSKFEHTVGLTYGKGQPEKVSLLVDELHVKYMRSLPLHQSQIIHKKNKEHKHQVDFYLYPNYEFKTQILKIGAEVEVLSPQYLRDEVIGLLEKSLNNYK